MKKILIYSFIIIFLLCCIIFGLKFGMNLKYENDMQEIKDSHITDLDEYNSNLSLAKSYLSVYDIIDESSYQIVKNDMYNHFSDSMQKEIFPTVNYEGISLHPMETQFISCVGTNNKGSENVFKLVYRLTGVNYDQEITNLITISNGVISRVERIK